MTISEVMKTSASRLERKRAKNRDALISAARRLFARDGLEATTIAGIAEAADLGFGTFYRYFPDKESILETVLDAGRLEIGAVLSHPENDQAPAAAALRGFSSRFAQAVRRNHDVLALMWQVGIRAEATGAKRVRPERSLPVMLTATIRRIIERGVASGEFIPVDAVLLSRFIASAHMYLLSPSAMDVNEQTLIDTLCEFELRALTAAANDAPSAKAGRSGR